MKFLKRSDRHLERDLASLRSEPTEEFIHSISSRVLRGRRVERSSRMKVGLAMSLTALGLVVFAVFGGLGYAGSAASKATKVVNVVKVSNTSNTVKVTPKPTPTPTPAPTPAPTPTTSTSGAKVITWTGNGTTGGFCSSVSGTGNTQTWQFNLTSPFSSGSSTLTATFQSAGTKTASVAGGTSVIKWFVTTGKNDKLLSASATNGTKNSVLTISHCTLSGTPSGGGGSSSDDHSSSGDHSEDDDSSGGGGGGGNCSGGGSGGGNSHSDDNDSSSDDKSDAKSDDNDASSDDKSDSHSGGGGGAGGNQYGGCIPICHKVSTGKYVLQLISSTQVALHQSHGDIVPAPASGCPGGGSNSDDDSSVDNGSDDNPKCNSGRGNKSEGNSSQLIKPSTGSKGTSPTVDCDPGNSGSKNKGGD